MIVIEDMLRDLFAQIPSIQINANNTVKPTFSWGKKEELNRYIEKYKSALYPLIWLLPDEDTHNILSDMVTRKVTLIVATLETREELFNPQRYEGSFKTVLNPLVDYIVQGLQNSNATRIIDTDAIRVFKEPNYSESDENGTIDKWDAIRLECNVEFNNNCLNTLKWK